jgi:hypothetical protein
MPARPYHRNDLSSAPWRAHPILALLAALFLCAVGPFGQNALAQLQRTTFDDLEPFFYYRLSPTSLDGALVLTATDGDALTLAPSDDSAEQAWKLTAVPVNLSPDDGIFDDTEYRLTSQALGEGVSLSFLDRTPGLRRTTSFFDQSWLVDVTDNGGLVLSIYDDAAETHLSLAIGGDGDVTLIEGRGSGEVWQAARSAPVIGSFVGVWEATGSRYDGPSWYLIERRDDRLIVLDITFDHQPELTAQADLDPNEPRVVALRFEGGDNTATLLTPNHIILDDGTVWERR